MSEKRIIVLSRDGNVVIDVSEVYRNYNIEKQISSGEPLPVHLYGYGSYIIYMDVNFH